MIDRGVRIRHDMERVMGGLFVNAPVADDNFDVDGVRRAVDLARIVCRRSGIGIDVAVVRPDSGHEFPDAVRKRAYLFLESWLGESSGG